MATVPIPLDAFSLPMPDFSEADRIIASAPTPIAPEPGIFSAQNVFGATSALTAVAGAAGTVISAVQRKRALEAAAELADAAAALAEQRGELNAIQLEKFGDIAAQEERRVTRRLYGENLATLARSGTVIGTGSNLDLSLQNAVDGELTALRAAYGFDNAAFVTRVNTAAEAFQIRTGAQGARNQATATLATGVTRAVSGANTRLQQSGRAFLER